MEVFVSSRSGIDVMVRGDTKHINHSWLHLVKEGKGTYFRYFRNFVTISTDVKNVDEVIFKGMEVIRSIKTFSIPSL